MRCSYISATELSHQTEGILQGCWTVPEHIVFSSFIVCNNSSLLPDEKIFDPLSGAGNNTLCDGVGLFTILRTHNDCCKGLYG